MKDRHNSPALWASDVSWMFGYMTAMGRFYGPRRLEVLTPKDFPAEISAICTVIPQMNLSGASDLLGSKHGLFPPPPD
jgi:hypothetical protein